MITYSASDVLQAGGLLGALACKSCEYVRSIIPDVGVSAADAELLERVIVHSDPHLDEYFAALIFRACLPAHKWNCPFMEQSIFSADSDLACQVLWPTAAVLGIGGAAAGGVQPLFLFDEHISGSSRSSASCSQVVVGRALRHVPDAIAAILVEVNAIDEHGGAHPQHLGTIIKSLHDVRYSFGLDDDGVERRDALTAEWKRALVDACLTAVIGCLRDGIDLVGEPGSKRASMVASLDNYVRRSRHVGHPRFSDATRRIKSVYGDQARVFRDAVLRTRQGVLMDSTGRALPQLLILSRVCYALERYWGERVRDIVATHIWELECQNQLNFYAVEEAIEAFWAEGTSKAATPVGVLTRAVLPDITPVMTAAPGQQRGRVSRTPVWIISVTPASGVFKPNRAISNFLNRRNFGCGLILVRDVTLGTSALMKGQGVPAEKWERLVTEIKTLEPECWHVIGDDGDRAPFILNGNKAHQYVPRTALDSTGLCELVKRTFY